MKTKILSSLPDPEALERLFREDRSAFMEAFPHVVEENDSELLRFWKLRLETESLPSPEVRIHPDWKVAAAIALWIAAVVLLPSLFPAMKREVFYMRNMALIVLSGLTAYTLCREKITETKSLLVILLPLVLLALYLNFLPRPFTDTSILVFLHAPLLCWALFGLAWTRLGFRNNRHVFGFLRYNGELVTMTGLILIAGIFLSLMTISLFALIGMEISRFYMQNIAVAGAAASPVLAAWLISQFPSVTGKVVPLIARIFTPMVLISAVIYLPAILVSGVRLSENRDFLVMFNLLLFAVMAIIVFSLSEMDRSATSRIHLYMLLSLVVVTLLINSLALAAIITRLTEGFTPNRTAVLLSNLVVFIHLLVMLPVLWSVCFRQQPYTRIGKAVTRYLPLYILYTLFVILIFPLLW